MKLFLQKLMLRLTPTNMFCSAVRKRGKMSKVWEHFKEKKRKEKKRENTVQLH